VKTTTRVILILSLACSALSGQTERGTICVAPNSSEPPRRISPGGDYNPATLTLSVDKGKPIPWPHKDSVKIDDLSLGERHLIVLTSDGKRIQSFRFRFSDYKSTDLCIDFDGYQGVRLQERKFSPWCKCK
jgi:hypothetical protein